MVDKDHPLYVDLHTLCTEEIREEVAAYHDHPEGYRFTFTMDHPVLQEYLRKISVARCARVSYLTHDGKRDYAKDIELHDKCRDLGHWSAF